MTAPCPGPRHTVLSFPARPLAPSRPVSYSHARGQCDCGVRSFDLALRSYLLQGVDRGPSLPASGARVMPTKPKLRPATGGRWRSSRETPPHLPHRIVVLRMPTSDALAFPCPCDFPRIALMVTLGTTSPPIRVVPGFARSCGSLLGRLPMARCSPTTMPEHVSWSVLRTLRCHESRRKSTYVLQVCSMLEHVFYIT